MYAKEIKKMKYIITGKGGQGVLFIAKTLSYALMLSKIYNFTFLKEFDEGQRNGEIKITFMVPMDLPDKELIVKENNILELKKISKELLIDDKYIKGALEFIKPNAFEKNWRMYNETN